MEMSRYLHIWNVSSEYNILEFFRCTSCCQFPLYDLYPNHAKTDMVKKLIDYLIWVHRSWFVLLSIGDDNRRTDISYMRRLYKIGSFYLIQWRPTNRRSNSYTIMIKNLSFDSLNVIFFHRDGHKCTFYEFKYID